MPRTFRNKFINDAIEMCDEKKGRLNEWEQRFVKDIKSTLKMKHELTTTQYNKLQEIYSEIK